MAKFPIGSTVKYSGEVPALQECARFSSMTVVDIIPDGIPIGNGEVNRSGKNVYRLQDLSGTMFNFLESELSLV